MNASVSTSSDSTRVSRAQVGWAAIYIGMIAWAILWSFPWVLEQPAIHPTDPSFTPLAHVFFAEGRPWGADTLHTGGIWGFLRFPMFNPETFSLLVTIHVALGALIGWFFADSSRSLPRGRWLLLLVSAALLPLLSASGIKLYGPDLEMPSDDARWYIPIFALLVMRAREKSPGLPTPLVVALSLGAAMALHTKGNFFIATIVVVLATLASDLYQRRMPWTLVLVLGWTIVLLYAGGGDLARFARYTLHVVDSTKAYPEAFSYSSEVLAPVVFLLGVACASAAWFLQVKYRWQWPLAVAFSILLFLLYKGAFVRYDAIHMMRSLTVMVLLMSTGIVAVISRWPSSLIPRRRAIATVGLGVASLVLFLAPLLDPDIGLPLLHELRGHPAAAVAFLETSLETRQQQLDERLASIRKEAPLQDIEGSIATIGTYHTVLMAHGVREETIPVIAHYEVWSPRTVAAIDRFLESDEAPQFLLRSANYTSVSNELTLARFYRPIHTEEYYTLLERRDEPLVVSSQTIFDGSVRWHETINIPEEHWGSVLVAEVRFEKNLAGRLVGFFHHPAHANMIVDKSDGTRARVRLNSLLASDGVVVAAYVGRPAKGNWGGAAWALHYARHPILTESKAEVRRLKFQARTLCGSKIVRLKRRRSAPRCADATALFERELQVKIRALSFATEAESIE